MSLRLGSVTELLELIAEIPKEDFGALFGRSLLSDRAILRCIDDGSIVIDPFERRSLGTCSYDVTLGEWFWREQHPEGGITTFNPRSDKDVRRVWGEKPLIAEPARTWTEKNGPLENIHPDDKVIWIKPGETILCHTNEFIGGQKDRITTMMKARSTLGRVFIEICKCAGWGDVGYVNRWTMEVTNNSRHYHIPLVVGTRVAQIAFFEVEPIATRGLDYTVAGKYQTTASLDELKIKWEPTAMLPKMSHDREIRK
jgi:dCTP deaminase